MIEMIALNKLSLSDLNVRKTERDADIASLADDIAAHGLKQNLVAVPNGKAGHYEVIAGGRRFQALKLLVERKERKATDKVPVLIEDPAQAVETSLSENLQRVAMNPADELDAFRTIIDAAEGTRDERMAACAKRFGVTVRHVEQRLRLAELAPDVLEGLRAGTITLDLAKAFAATPDQARQQAVWDDYFGENGARQHWRPGTNDIRAALSSGSVNNGDRRAIYVGRKAYEKAGGAVEIDMFAQKQAERWTDLVILDRLAFAKLDAQAQALRESEGWGTVVAYTEQSYIGYDITSRLHSFFPHEAKQLSPEKTAEREALDERRVALIDELNEEPDEAEEDRLNDEIDRLEAQIEELDAAGTTIAIPAAEDRGHFIRFLLIDANGRPELVRRLYSEVPLDPATGRPAAAQPEAKAAPREDPLKAHGLTQKLVDELALQRRDVLAVELFEDPDLATLYGQFSIIDRAIADQRKLGISSYYQTPHHGSSLKIGDVNDPVSAYNRPGHLKDTPAQLAFHEHEAKLDWNWCGGPDASWTPADMTTDAQLLRFIAFEALPASRRAEWFAWAVAKSLKASDGVHRIDRVHDQLGRFMAVDTADHWRPTIANYWGRVPQKPLNQQFEAATGGLKLSGVLIKPNKALMNEYAEMICSGSEASTAHAEKSQDSTRPGQYAKAARWTPPVMQFRGKPTE